MCNHPFYITNLWYMYSQLCSEGYYRRYKTISCVGPDFKLRTVLLKSSRVKNDCTYNITQFDFHRILTHYSTHLRSWSSILKPKTKKTGPFQNGSWAGYCGTVPVTVTRVAQSWACSHAATADSSPSLARTMRSSARLSLTGHDGFFSLNFQHQFRSFF